MRRSDQEFKEELWLRAAEYKARQRKRRGNALKAASVAVVACVLFISAKGVKFAGEEWQWPTDEPVIDGPMADGTTAASGEIVDGTEEAADEIEGVVTDAAEEPTADYGGEATESPTIDRGDEVTESPTVDCGGEVTESPTDVGAEALPENGGASADEQAVGLTILWIQGANSEEAVESTAEQSSRDAQSVTRMQDFLEGLLALAEDKLHYNSGASGTPETEDVSRLEHCRITLSLEDGTVAVYTLYAGSAFTVNGDGDKMILNGEQWSELLRLVGEMGE